MEALPFDPTDVVASASSGWLIPKEKLRERFEVIRERRVEFFVGGQFQVRR